MQLWNPEIGEIVTGLPQNLSANLTITQANWQAYDGKTLVFTGAFTITIAAGIGAGFQFACKPPASGNASIAASGVVLLNGAGTTVTRTLASNLGFAVYATAQDAYTVTGT